MSSSRTTPTPRGDESAYLCVDDYLGTMVDAQALKCAFEIRLIEHLERNPISTLEQTAQALAIDRRGLVFLLDLLKVNHVVESTDQDVRLTGHFRAALPYRDLLEAKIDFAQLVAPDVLARFTTLIANPGEFMRQARLFDLFDYRRGLDSAPDNMERTKKWVRLTTCLTRYEARACMSHHDFGRYRRMLDIGGNSGEFVLQVCKRHAEMEATVFDLPGVCEIGREHVRAEAEAKRITFLEGNALADPLPAGFDLITFKSFLHDWPELEAKRFITRASHALSPSGTLLIFERSPFQVNETSCRYGMIPMLLFFRSFRQPSLYQEQLEVVGLKNIHIQEINLEMPFCLVTGNL